MKVEKYLQSVRFWLPILQCPICGHPILIQGTSLVCETGHCFDASAKGYIPFSPSTDALYSEKLFAARSAVFASGMYDVVVDAIHSSIAQYAPADMPVLDAGCGDGFYIRQLSARDTRLYAGVDLSGAGIRRAAQIKAPLWCVGDLTKLPFADSSFGCILNILSPASYDSFRRVLKEDGVLLKLLPAPGYLQELRGGVEAEERDSLAYSLEKMRLLQQQRISYLYPLSDSLKASLPYMTPLTSHWTEERIAGWIAQTRDTVTVDLWLLVGQL